MLKRYITIFCLLFSFSFGSTYVEDINNKIKKTEQHKVMVSLYNEYHFEQMKDILTFFDHNRFYKQFNELFDSLTYDEKIFIIQTIIDYPDKYQGLILNSDLYSKLFTYSNNYEMQEYQFKVYDMLLENQDSYLEFLTYSRISTHYDMIFNPNNILNVDSRYKHYIKKFILADYPISYINSIQYLFLSKEQQFELSKIGFDKFYLKSLDRLKSNDTEGFVPITVSSIFYDKSNKYKTLKVDYNFYIKTNIKYFLENINEKSFVAKYSHDLLKKYLKDGIITNIDLQEYLKMLSLDSNKLTIEDKENFLFIEVNDTDKKELYKSVEELIRNHSVTFIY